MNRSKSSFNILKQKKLVLFFLAGLLLSFIVFGPVISKLKLRLDTNKSLKADQAKLNIKLEFLEGIDKVLIDKRVKKMETVFPSKKPVVALLGSLSQLSKNHNLSFGKITLRPGVLSSESEEKDLVGELKDLKFGFQVVGDFDTIALFMKDLEKTAPLMKIDELDLSIKTNTFFKDEAIMVVADIKVLAYFQPPPTSLGSVDKAVEFLDKKDEALLNQLFSFKAYETVLPMAQTGKVDLFSSGLQGLL
ncbi:MAG: hypothetical protein ABIJ43_06060 [Candidatus Beckwithbacteria bacterium]|nr:type 4a pilus biogenesis protein PilO [Patescibacteria group bacterium]